MKTIPVEELVKSVEELVKLAKESKGVTPEIPIEKANALLLCHGVGFKEWVKNGIGVITLEIVYDGFTFRVKTDKPLQIGYDGIQCIPDTLPHYSP